MAKSGNSQIKAEKAKVEMAESGKNEARSRFMPTVTLSAGVTKINDPININLNEIRSGIISVHGAEAYQEYYKTGYDAAYQRATGAGMPEDMAIPISKGVGDSVGMLAKMKTESALDSALPDFKKKVQDDVFFNARLSVVWPIFTGLKIYSAYDAAKENVNARKAEFDMAQNAILMDVATRYFSLRLAEELTLLRETTKRNLEGHLERSKKLEEGGQISKAERLRAEVALAEAQNALEDAMRDQTLARLALASLLHTDTSITATTPVESPEEYRSIEELKAMAREKHPGLRQLRTERKRSKAAVSAARADYFDRGVVRLQGTLYERPDHAGTRMGRGREGSVGPVQGRRDSFQGEQREGAGPFAGQYGRTDSGQHKLACRKALARDGTCQEPPGEFAEDARTGRRGPA